MKMFIMVRHGEYDQESGGLKEEGRRQMISLAEKLRRIIGGSSALLLSSPSPRAKQSGEILSQQLGVDPPKAEMSLSALAEHDDYTPSRALGVVQSHGRVDVLIVVTDGEFAKRFPVFLAKWTTGKVLSERHLLTGEALTFRPDNNFSADLIRQEI